MPPALYCPKDHHHSGISMRNNIHIHTQLRLFMRPRRLVIRWRQNRPECKGFRSFSSLLLPWLGGHGIQPRKETKYKLLAVSHCHSQRFLQPGNCRRRQSSIPKKYSIWEEAQFPRCGSSSSQQKRNLQKRPPSLFLLVLMHFPAIFHSN